jgi:hypothetical protein
MTNNPVKHMIKNPETIGSIIGMLFGAGLFFTQYKELKNAQDSLEWPTTKGIVILSEVKTDESNESVIYKTNIHYKYTLKSQDYFSDRVSFGWPEYSDIEQAKTAVKKYKQGQNINIHFNPANPSESVIEPGMNNSSLELFFGVWIFLAGASGTLYYAIIFPRKQLKRTKLMKDYGSDVGLVFHCEDTILRRQALIHLSFFGHRSSFRNILVNERANVRIIICDSTFLDSGEDSSECSQTVAVFNVPYKSLPGFWLRPETPLDRVGEFFGGQDIDFENSPVFSSSYRLQGNSEPRIRELFDSNVLGFFSQNPGWWIEGSDEWLLIYKHKWQVEPNELRAFLQQATEISDLFFR